MAATAIRKNQQRIRSGRGPVFVCGATALLLMGAGQGLQAGGVAAETALPPSAPAPQDALEPSPRQAVGVQLGRFVFGKYAPNANNNYSSCTAITFCSEQGMFGYHLSLTYTRRLWQGGSSRLDADVGVAFGEQAVRLDNGRVAAINGGPSTPFALLTLVPTYRLQLPKPLKAVSLGAGLGISLATAQVPAEQPYDIPFNTQFNLEIAFKPVLDKGLEVVAALQHRCSFFGLLNQQDGRYSGSQWYSIGIRQWF